MRALPALALSVSLFLVALFGCVADAHAASVEDVFGRVRTSVVTLFTHAETGVRGPQGAVQTRSGLGSGVLLEGGRILTASHVVHQADEVVVVFHDGTRARANVIGSVVQGDIALLQVDGPLPASVRPAVLGDSDQVKIGSVCFLIGAPLGWTHTLTVGHISARRLMDDPADLLETEYFQTDAAINTGNSGGPMFDLRGRVIGIASHIRSKTGGFIGLGFAVTSNSAKRQLLDRNPIWVGMTEVLLSGALAQAFQLPEGQNGFLVQSVAKGSPAHRIGIRGGSIPAKIGNADLLIGGDIVLEALGVRLDSHQTGRKLLTALPDVRPDTVVRVKVLRAGRVLGLEAPASELAPWLSQARAR